MKNYLLTVLTTFCLTVPQACTTPQSPQKKEKEKKEVAIQLFHAGREFVLHQKFNFYRFAHSSLL